MDCVCVCLCLYHEGRPAANVSASVHAMLVANNNDMSAREPERFFLYDWYIASELRMCARAQSVMWCVCARYFWLIARDQANSYGLCSKKKRGII